MGALYWTSPSTESLTGQEKTSPSGMLCWPPHSLAPIPLIENRRSVPGPLRRTRSVRRMSAASAFIPGAIRE